MHTYTSDEIAKSRFFHQERIPRRLLPAHTGAETDEYKLLVNWIERIRRLTGHCGEAVNYYLPSNGGNKVIVIGNGPNAPIAAGLIRKAIIEISQEEFNPEDTYGFIVKTLEGFIQEQSKPPIRLPSCRVDFRIAPEDMNRAQSDAFEKLTGLFNKIGVDISRVENRPTVIELRSQDKFALKSAQLTAEWAAKTIKDEHEITRNKLLKAFGLQSVQAAGRERGRAITELAYN